MEKQINQTNKYLYSHTSPETAYVVTDYPWGFRLRTTIRYWIEKKDAKNGGQRFCSQTINPKTGEWCAPKRNTYSDIIIMFLDEKEHIKSTALGHNSGTEIINKFKEIHLENLTDFQKNKLKEIIAYDEVMKHVTFTVTPYSTGPVSLFSKDPEQIAKRKQIIEENEKKKIEQEKIMRDINRAIRYETSKVIL